MMTIHAEGAMNACTKFHGNPTSLISFSKLDVYLKLNYLFDLSKSLCNQSLALSIGANKLLCSKLISLVLAMSYK